ncbi:MAG: hypothetical protein PHT54_02395 [Candidatus Nanoarchaeia archaeon]|nr:hypothetical protein [Candidatus Nanoarchaeia archaeon]
MVVNYAGPTPWSLGPQKNPEYHTKTQQAAIDDIIELYGNQFSEDVIETTVKRYNLSMDIEFNYRMETKTASKVVSPNEIQALLKQEESLAKIIKFPTNSSSKILPEKAINFSPY